MVCYIANKSELKINSSYTIFPTFKYNKLIFTVFSKFLQHIFILFSGKAPPRGTTVELTHIDVPPNMNLWPLFHNGVATGLCIHPSASNVDSTWIVYNKQNQSEFSIEHSGFLMALGLNGHLKNLAPFSMYEYLVECHETTSVGLLLGLSATYRSSMDVSMTKLLSLHVETLLPPTSIELNVQQNVQVAALMGVGLVYQGTSHRHIAHALLSEIGKILSFSFQMVPT